MRRNYEYNSYYYPPRQQESYTSPRYPDVPKFYLLNRFISKEAPEPAPAPALAPAPARSDQTPPREAVQPLHQAHHDSNKKKVQFMSEKKAEVITDDNNNNNNNARPIRKDHDSTIGIDEAADGYIQQKHKKFELAKWMTFNTATNKDNNY